MNQRPIDEIAEAIIDYRGKTPPKSRSGIKLLTAKVIKDGGLDESRFEYINEETYGWWMRRGFPRQGDILLTTEAPLGETALLRTPERIALAQRVILLRGNPAIVDQLYLFAALRSPLVQNRLRQRATGTTVLGIKQRELRKVEIPLPPIDSQRKIGAILSTFDDLIENNKRRIKFLEEMTLRIYREWFINFRYPGHERTQVVNSELGPVPKGWRVTKLGALFPVVLGGTPSRKVARYWENGTISWINSGRVNDLRVIEPSELITEEALASSNAKIMPAGTTLVAITGATLGQVSLLEITACANQSVVGIYDPSDQLQEFIYLTVQHSIGTIIGAASGGAQQHINQQIVRETLVPVPPPQLTDRFRDTIRPMFEAITCRLRTQLVLKASRDFLLPRLISGAVDVTDLDIAMPEAAA